MTKNKWKMNQFASRKMPMPDRPKMEEITNSQLKF